MTSTWINTQTLRADAGYDLGGHEHRHGWQAALPIQLAAHAEWFVPRHSYSSAHLSQPTQTKPSAIRCSEWSDSWHTLVRWSWHASLAVHACLSARGGNITQLNVPTVASSLPTTSSDAGFSLPSCQQTESHTTSHNDLSRLLAYLGGRWQSEASPGRPLRLARSSSSRPQEPTLTDRIRWCAGACKDEPTAPALSA